MQDTAGEERFAGLSSFYCRGAGAAILAFDATNYESFQQLRYEIQRIVAYETAQIRLHCGDIFDIFNNTCPSHRDYENANFVTKTLF